MKKNISDLKDDVEYLIIQNETTGEIIAKFTQTTSYVKPPYIIRTKYKSTSNKETSNRASQKI